MRLFRDHFWPFPYHFTTIQDRFPTISGPFPTISGRFVNRSTSSRLILTISRPPLDQFSIVRKQLSHTDHSGAVQQWTTRPPKQEHRPNRTRPLTGGTTLGHRVKTQEKVIDKSNTHTQRRPNFRPFPLHFTPILTRLLTISWPFQTKYHNHTRTTQGRYNRGPPGH